MPAVPDRESTDPVAQSNNRRRQLLRLEFPSYSKILVPILQRVAGDLRKASKVRFLHLQIGVSERYWDNALAEERDAEFDAVAALKARVAGLWAKVDLRLSREAE
jgi:hypothetical protein